MPSSGSELDSQTVEQLKSTATRLRINSVTATNASKSGHPTSCSSAAEIMSVLFFHTMKYKLSAPRDPSSDRFVMSKGHAAPILYAAWAEAGLFPVEDLLNLRKIDSDLEGHPTPRLSFVDVATGSLGQGLSCAAGMAYTGKYFDKASYRVYCLIGDGESAEGSIWEALSFASHYKLDNLVAIFDVNRLGQSEPTAFQHDLETYKLRLESFGWNTSVVDGHNISALCKALHEAATVKGKPTCLLAKTFKGKDFQGIEDQENWHGKPLGDKTENVIKELTASIKNAGPTKLVPPKPTEDAPKLNMAKICLSQPPSYKLGENIATRVAYGTALIKLGQNNDRIVALDGDTKNSTYSEKFKKAFPDRFIECFIAEQNMLGVAIGCGTRDRTIPFVSAFAAFFTRGFDQLRMGAISQANIKCVGSHAGISIGEDGPSQMALEDLAMFRTIPGSTVFYPSDAVSTERACELAANIKGICFIRTSRPDNPVIYENNETFEVGKSKVVCSSKNDKVLIIGAGVTLHEAMKAAKELQEAGINIRVMDIFSLKPIDDEGILLNAKAAGNRVITVEDHYPEGGIGEAVAGSLENSNHNVVMKRLAVQELPRSGSSAELLDKFGINARNIIKAVHDIIR